jgi:hypothetical protein
MPFSSSKTNPPVFSRRSFALFFLAVFVFSMATLCLVKINYIQAEKHDLPPIPEPVAQQLASGQANSGDNMFIRGIKWLLGMISYAIFWVFSWLVYAGGRLLDFSFQIMNKEGFVNSQVVQLGWPIIRDLANMFFSVVLLVIAFATILRIETYGMKQVLWRLVVAALLINFSLVIAGVIIDASNVLTTFFIERASGGEEWGISANLLDRLQVQKLNEPEDKAGEKAQGKKGFLAILINLVLGSAFMIITAFVLLAAAILLYIRMVALWILLIFSPLAWLSMILPGTRSMVWSKWWHEFIKYVLFAPVYAFFLYLTLALLDKDEGFLFGTKKLQKVYLESGFLQSTFLENMELVTNYVILIIFLLAGLIFARSSGIAGANVVANMGKSYGRMWSRWAAKGGAVPGMGWVAKKTGLTDKLNAWQTTGTGWRRGLANTIRGAGAVKRTAFAMMSPQSWSRAWAMRKQRADAASFDKGAGRLDDLITGLGSIRRLGTKVAGSDTTSSEEKERIINEEEYHVYQARMRGDAEYRGIKTSPQEIKDYLASKNIPEGSPKAQAEMQEWDKQRATDLYAREFRQEKRRGLGYVFNETFGPGMREQMAESREVARRQQEYQQTIRDEDQLVHYFLNARDPVEKEALLRMVASINALNTTFGRLGIQLKEGMLQNYIQKNFSASRAPIIGADVSAMAAQNGNFSAVGLTKWDAQRNQIVFTNAAEQGAIAASKAMQMPTQSWAINSHPDSFITRDASGAYVGLSEYAKAMLKNITAAHTEQVGRFQGRTLAALYQFRDQMENYIKANISGVQQQIALDFVERIRTRYETA